MQETWVWSLGWEDPLEKEMANPLQYSCLGNPIDSAWQATVHGVTRSWTQQVHTNDNKVIQFQIVEPEFEPKPLSFRVYSVNYDTIQSYYNDDVEKADLVRKHDDIGFFF